MIKKKIIFLILGIIIVASMIVLLYSSQNSFFMYKENIDNIHRVIADKLGVNSNSLTILETKEDRYFYVLYQNNDIIGLMIFEHSGLLPNQYSFNGSSSSASKNINTYSYKGPKESSGGIIVVFGDNTEIKAHSYSFTNSGNEYSSIIQEDFFIDVYFFDEMKTTSCEGFLFNKDGKAIAPL